MRKTRGQPVRHAFVGAANVLLGTALAYVVWKLLPARNPAVDVAIGVVAALLVACGVGLALGASWARRAAILVSSVAAIVGLVLTTLLALSVSYLAGSFGVVGTGGAAIFGAVGLLVVAYLVMLPVAQMAWLARENPRRDLDA